MMPDVLVEEKVCGKCGVKVRRDTQFCHNCGESVEADIVPKPDVTSPNVTKAGDAILVTDGIAGSPTGLNGLNASPAPIGNSKLTSAASLRRQARTLERKSVEVIWEPAENRANLPLIISTIVLLIFTLAVIVSALYYR
jgi:hypothetical protein